MVKLTKSGAANVITGRINPALYVDNSLAGASIVVNVYQYEADVNHFLESPTCIVPRLYVNKGPYNGDHTRTNVDATGLPTFPVVTKTFDAAA